MDNSGGKLKLADGVAQRKLWEEGEGKGLKLGGQSSPPVERLEWKSKCCNYVVSVNATAA